MRKRLFIFTLLVFHSALGFAGEDDLAYYLPPHEVIWITPETEATEDSESNDDAARFLLLYRPGERPFSRGVSITISDWGRHPLQQTYPALIYKGLPQYGWESFALHPPTYTLQDFRWETPNGTPYPQAADTEALQVLNQHFATRLRTAMSHVQTRPGFRLVIAEGLSAALLVDLIATGEITGVDAVILISPYYPQWQLNRSLSETIAQLQIPVLDLQLQNGNFWSEDEAARRQLQAQRYQHTGYRQRHLSASTHRQNIQVLNQVIYGWLSYEGF